MRALVVIFVAIFLVHHSEVYSNSDSLFNVWQNSNNHDTIRLEAYKIFIWEEYMFYDVDSALSLSFNFYEKAREMKQLKYMGSALNHQAVAFSLQGDIDKAILKYEEAVRFYLDKGMEERAAPCYSNLGGIYNQIGDFQKSAEYYFKALTIFEKTDDQAKLAATFNNLGVLYNGQKMYELALGYYKKSTDIKLKLGYDKDIGVAYMNIGALHGDMGQNDLSKKYYKKALEFINRSNDLGSKGNYCMNMGHLCYKNADFDSSLYYYELALDVYKKIDDRTNIVTTEINIGTAYLQFGENELAAMYLVDAYEKAKDFQIFLSQRAAAEALSELYEETKNYKFALFFKKEFHLLNDSLTDAEQQEQTLNLKFEHDYEKKAFADSLEYVQSQELNILKISEQEAQIQKDRTQKYALFGGISLLLLFGAFAYRTFQRKKRDHETISLQHQELAKTHNEIKQSIDYAKRLQDVFMPSSDVLKQYFPSHFLLFKPKDVVSGDFYWFEYDEASETRIIAVADCTGHGVPGALVSIVCSSALNKVVKELGVIEPSEILSKTRSIVIETFRKTGREVRDGMDITICAIKNKVIKMAGANNGLWLIKNTEDSPEVIEFKADRQAVGWSEDLKPFTQAEILVEAGDMIYLLTDGFPDQFGGEKGKKLKKAPLKNFLLEIYQRDMESQHSALDHKFESWRGKNEQIDDLCIMGIKF